MEKILVASHNEGKIKEFKDMLEPLGYAVISALDLEVPDVEETGTTFEENAKLKADEISKVLNVACIADDSGLCVDVLGGRPGVYSARYAPNRDFEKGMDMLIEEINSTGTKDRFAHFACVLVLSIPNDKSYVFEGKVEGKIAFEKKGDKGFGFDKVFIPNGYQETFGQMSKELKNSMSHRGRALEKLVEFLRNK